MRVQPHSARLLLIGLFLLYVGCSWLVFGPMVEALHGHWTRTNDIDAGYLLFVITLYALWVIGGETHRSPPGSSELIGFAVLCLAVWGAAGLTSITANKSVTLALLVLGFVPLGGVLGGFALARRLAHACAILMMATPIWFVLVPALQGLTATAVNWLLLRGSWPIFIDGNLIALPAGTLEIAAGCAGLKFLQTALALVLIEGFVARRSLPTLALIALAAVVLALISNWIRVATITLLALYLGVHHPWVADHNWVGWVIFAALFAPGLYWLSGWNGGVRVEQTTSHSLLGLHTGALFRVVGCLGASALLVVLLGYMASGPGSEEIAQRQLAALGEDCQSRSLPQHAGRKTEASDAPDHPAAALFHGADLVLDCRLPSGAYLSARGYLRETQSMEVIHPDNELFPGQSVLGYAVGEARKGDEAPQRFERGGVSAAYGFYASGHWTASPGVFKWHSLARPFKPGPVWALVITTQQIQVDTELDFRRLAQRLLKAG